MDKIIKKLGLFRKVVELKTNQYEIVFENGSILQSYDSLIAIRVYVDDIIYLGCDWDYSRTTGKYRNEFLGMDKKELQQLIKEGKAIVL